LPLAVSGKLVEHYEYLGTMYPGSFCSGTLAAHRDDFRALRNNVSDQAHFSSSIFLATNYAFAYILVLSQRPIQFSPNSMRKPLTFT